jgi:hemerythrin
MHTGVVVIDEQHVKIVEYVNRLDDVMDRKCDSETILEAIDKVVAYTIYHFSYEESMLEKANYPFLKAHKRVHELFARRLSEYQERFKAGEHIAEEFHMVMTDWLIKHVEYDDRDFVASVNGINKSPKENNPGERMSGIIRQAVHLVTPSKSVQDIPSRLMRAISER